MTPPTPPADPKLAHPAWRRGEARMESPIGKPGGCTVLVHWIDSDIRETAIWDGKDLMLPAFVKYGVIE